MNFDYLYFHLRLNYQKGVLKMEKPMNSDISIDTIILENASILEDIVALQRSMKNPNFPTSQYISQG